MLHSAFVGIAWPCLRPAVSRTDARMQVGNAPSSVLMAWCPTMDLLAYVTSENLTDGRTLASGHEDGRIALYDIELQETVASLPAHSARITALMWAPWLGSEATMAVIYPKT